MICSKNLGFRRWEMCGVSTFSESKRMMFEEENLFGLSFFALYQATTSVVPPLVQK